MKLFVSHLILHRILARYLLLPVLLTMIYFISTKLVNAQTQEIQITKNQMITQAIQVNPGYATIIEFPETILSMTLADSNIFQCVPMLPSDRMITCKTLVRESYSTNLIVVTESNEFNLMMSVRSQRGESPFKYSFHNPSLKPKDQISPETNDHLDSCDLLPSLLSDYKHQECKQKNINSYAEIICLEKISIGTDVFLKFRVGSKSKTKFVIINCYIAIQTLGGFTGLAIKEELPISSMFQGDVF